MKQPLVHAITQHIRANGPITFARFMELALYDPEGGYYASAKRGPGADYLTSPLLGPHFARLISKAFERMWQLMGRPDPFTVIEVGGGNGKFAADVFDSRMEMSRALRWKMVEPLPELRADQQKSLEGRPAEWIANLAETPPSVGCVFANELLDNFPVHLFEVGDMGVSEVFVRAEGDHLCEMLGPPSSNELNDLARKAASHLEEGDRFEIRTGLYDWVKSAAAALENGYLLFIDYGDFQPEIWTQRPGGTLVTYRDEILGTNLLAEPGLADITAHVDFTELAEASAKASLTGITATTQLEFLETLGAGLASSELRARQNEAESRGDHAATLTAMAERGRLAAIKSRGGLGDLLVLIAAKNAPPYA